MELRKHASIGGERQQRGDARALDGVLQLALMQRAGAGNAARQNLSALGDELLERLHVFEVDVLDLLDAELADALAAIEELLLAALLSARTAATVVAAAAGTAARTSTSRCHRSHGRLLLTPAAPLRRPRPSSRSPGPCLQPGQRQRERRDGGAPSSGCAWRACRRASAPDPSVRSRAAGRGRRSSYGGRAPTATYRSRARRGGRSPR